VFKNNCEKSNKKTTKQFVIIDKTSPIMTSIGNYGKF